KLKPKPSEKKTGYAHCRLRSRRDREQIPRNGSSELAFRSVGKSVAGGDRQNFRFCLETPHSRRSLRCELHGRCSQGGFAADQVSWKYLKEERASPRLPQGSTLLPGRGS